MTDDLLREVIQADRDAAWQLAFACGVPDIKGPRQQQEIAEHFARHRLTFASPTPEPSGAVVDDIARRALMTTEMARTDVVNPVNGTAPYSYVMFHGKRVEFGDGEWALPQERDAGSGKAAAYAQLINDALFELAKTAARTALASLDAGSASS